jgi:rod shape-determining protein MreB
VLELPNVVTVDSESWEVVYTGEKAKQTIGRTPDSLVSVYPIEHGVISDYDLTEYMLKEYMQLAFGNKVLRPRIMATLPAGLAELQHHSLMNVLEAAGGRNITVIESPLAIAFGLGLDFSKPHGTLIVDIGAGTTDVAVVSMGAISSCKSFKTASFDIDAQIIRYVRKEYNIEIGRLTAEAIKIKVGTAIERDVEIAVIANGKNALTGLPERFEINSTEVYEAIKGVLDSICNSIREVLNKTDPDLVADIMNDGLYLAGGGSKLLGFPQKIEQYLGVKVHHLEDPAYSVVKGAAAALKKNELIKNVDYQMRTIKELEIE